MIKKNGYTSRLVSILGSSLFFRLTIVILVLQSVWIALSGRYPMAYDEDYHLGIIRLYAHHLSPFWSSQPAGADAYGAVARDPSYLYHYLMSFPYRLISSLTGNQTVQVLFLRSINIALFTAGVILFRQLLLKSRASRTKVNAVMAVFVLLPIVPFLAAQINYDNLFLPLTAATLLVATRIAQNLRQQQTLRPRWLLGLIIICLLTSLVKFVFLPIALAVFVYLAVCVKRAYPGYRPALASFKIGWRSIKPLTRLLLVLGVVIGGWLFAERYAVNTVRYHALVPSCDQVLTVQQCSAYGPWNRDYNLAQSKTASSSSSPVLFSGYWFYGMWLRTFFAVAGPANNFQTRGPLTLPGIGVIVMAVASTTAAVFAGRRLLTSHDGTVITLFILVSVFYVGALSLDEYRAFVRTGQAVAMNGRYLLPVLPMLMLMAVLGLGRLVSRRGSALIMIIFCLCMLWGGGALTFILRSNDAWYWPNGAVRAANHAVQRTIGPLTPGYRHPTQFLQFN